MSFIAGMLLIWIMLPVYLIGVVINTMERWLGRQTPEKK